MPTFKVRDLRNKQFFMMDDAYLNGYARHLGPHATVVYLSLCRHADKEQSAFPSQKLIAEEHNIGERTVRDKLNLLEVWNIIRVERTKAPDGTWMNNTYFLLDKSEWKTPPAADAAGHPPAADDTIHRQMTAIVHRQPLPHKETHHIKETHNKDNTTNVVLENQGYGNPDINSGIALLKEALGGVLPKAQANRFALHNLFKTRGKERTLKAMDYALRVRGTRYAPVITSYMDLWDKWDQLEAFARRHTLGSGSVDAGAILDQQEEVGRAS